MAQRDVITGVADHFGWAVAVTAADDRVVDRRRIALVEDGLTEAPIHYSRGRLSDPDLAALVADVRASAARAVAAAFDALPPGVDGICLREWPPDFPTDIAVLRRAPWEARADAVMYRQVLAEVAAARGWAVEFYDAKDVEARATDILGGPLPRPDGPPWTKDHRVAFAAAVVSA